MDLFQALSNCPRPENYLIDLNNGLNGTGHPEFIWSSIASACESGIDFSTRWYAHQGKYAGEFLFVLFISYFYFKLYQKSSQIFQKPNIRSGPMILSLLILMYLWLGILLLLLIFTKYLEDPSIFFFFSVFLFIFSCNKQT